MTNSSTTKAARPDPIVAALTLTEDEATIMARTNPDGLRSHITRARAQAARDETDVFEARDLLRNAATRESKARFQKRIDTSRARIEVVRGLATAWERLIEVLTA